MTLTRLAGGRIIDPANGRRGEAADLFLRDGRIVAAPEPGTRIDETCGLAGRIVMPGGIDIHSHIAGGKVNLARLLTGEDQRAHPLARRPGRRSGGGRIAPSSFAAGYRYAELGYTAAFEPAMVPANARHAHAELADTPLIDKGCYVMLGNDELLLRLLAEDAEPAVIADYVGWMVEATQALAVKVVNPGGISAFKYNARDLRFDEPGPRYGITPRRVLTALARAVDQLGLAHPLHVHANQLGVPGNLATTLATIAAAEGLRLHLTHLQFHSYGREGDRRFSSGAAEIAEAVNGSPQISVDVGQIAFGQTITASGDSMMQYRNRRHAHPRKWLCMDIECDGGCGLVPFRYRDRSFVNALQWAIGLELFLLVEDPWRIFLTTDHPNGAPFTTYPHVIRLLMDRSFRRERLAAIHPAAAAASRLASIEREYDLSEIAIITRAGPARALGLADRGHLGPGAVADIAVYDDLPDRQAMFERPTHVFKEGRLVARDGDLVDLAWGATHAARPEIDPAIERRIADHFARFMTMRAGNFRIADGEIETSTGRLLRHPARRAS